jgi:hypothetical protein
VEQKPWKVFDVDLDVSLEDLARAGVPKIGALTVIDDTEYRLIMASKEGGRLTLTFEAV